MTPDQSLLIVVSGLGVLLGLVAAFVSIYSGLRRNPPLEQELINYVRRVDFVASEERMKNQMAAMKTDLDSATKEIFSVLREFNEGSNRTFQDVIKALGKLEGKIDEHCKNGRT